MTETTVENTKTVPSDFVCFLTEEEYADPNKRKLVLDRWKAEGAKQGRVTIVNNEFPNPPYPHGVWLEAWLQDSRQLPFGAEHTDGLCYPSLIEGDA